MAVAHAVGATATEIRESVRLVKRLERTCGTYTGPTRHKLLDAIGDLRTAGYRIIGHYHGERAGHALNNKLLRALFADATAYVIEDAVSTDWDDVRIADAAD